VAVIAQPADTTLMPEYRVYIIGSDGHFFNSVELDCADDSEAMERANNLLVHDVELWQRDRKIGQFDYTRKSNSK
jgi:hypothetical protein